MKGTPFFKQADLLVQMIPFVHAETCFALKGGTATGLRSAQSPVSRTVVPDSRSKPLTNPKCPAGRRTCYPWSMASRFRSVYPRAQAESDSPAVPASETAPSPFEASACKQQCCNAA